MSATAFAEATARAQVYELLAAVFRRPLNARQLEGLRTTDMLAAMAAAGIDPGDGFTTDPFETVLDRLAIDYTQLFHGPETHIVPYQSVLLDKGDELMGPAALEVRNFMAQAGFEVTRDSGELPDHIGVELAFLAALAQREAAARETDDAQTAERIGLLQRQFLAAHLGRWAGLFADKVQARASTGFYAAMADFLARFVATERVETPV